MSEANVVGKKVLESVLTGARRANLNFSAGLYTSLSHHCAGLKRFSHFRAMLGGRAGAHDFVSENVGLRKACGRASSRLGDLGGRFSVSDAVLDWLACRSAPFDSRRGPGGFALLQSGALRFRRLV